MDELCRLCGTSYASPLRNCPEICFASWLGSPSCLSWSPAFRRFTRRLFQLSHASRRKAGLQLIDPRRITASPYRTPSEADSAESPATENGKQFRDGSLTV